MRKHRTILLPLAAVGAAAAIASAGVSTAAPDRSAPQATMPVGETAARVASLVVLATLAVPATTAAASPAPPPGGVTVALSSLVLPVVPAPHVTQLPIIATTTTTSTTAVPAPSPPTVTAPASPAAPGSPAGGVWAELRQCESGGNYATDTGNGYYGAYQFSAATWHGLGYPGLPNEASPAVQDQAAAQLQARSGWGQWPACSRKLGL
jgi:hypothetical protein